MNLYTLILGSCIYIHFTVGMNKNAARKRSLNSNASKLRCQRLREEAIDFGAFVCFDGNEVRSNICAIEQKLCLVFAKSQQKRSFATIGQRKSWVSLQKRRFRQSCCARSSRMYFRLSRFSCRAERRAREREYSITIANASSPNSLALAFNRLYSRDWG